MSKVKIEIRKGTNGYEAVLTNDGQLVKTYPIQNEKNPQDPVGFRLKLDKDGELESHSARVLSAAPLNVSLLYERAGQVYNNIEIGKGKGDDGDKYVAKVIGTEDYRKLVGASTGEQYFDLNKSAVSFYLEYAKEGDDDAYYLKISAR